MAKKKKSIVPPSSILVGTYRKDQLEKWVLPRGLYNYAIHENDTAIKEAASSVTELWLYAGKKNKLRFSASFVREITSAELDDLDYPRKKTKPHSNRYLLFRISPLAEAPTLFPEIHSNRIFLRLSDFTQSPTVRAKLKRAIGPTNINAKIPSAETKKQLLTNLAEKLEEESLGTLFICDESERYNLFQSHTISEFCETSDQRALVSHWLQNLGTPAARAYEERALDLIPRWICDLLPRRNMAAEGNLPPVQELFPDLFAIPFPAPENPRFRFIDLFAGIGGFHLAMEQLGGRCVFASEWDEDCKRTYEANYGITPFGDIKRIDERDIPAHDVLCAGFPCQPFSKAGQQLGFGDETKGTLFFDIERILRHHHTRFIVLENVRNLVAHDNGNTWRTISNHLRALGYRLTPEPLIVSPHHFGIPQIRERVVILGIRDPEHANEPLHIELPPPHAKEDCAIANILERGPVDPSYMLSPQEIAEIDMWNEFYQGIHETVIGFPIWAEWFQFPPEDDMPDWKRDFIRKNNQLYRNNQQFIDCWLARHDNRVHVTPTMRKMEWQCGDALDSAWDALMQKRPSGLRIKRPDCAPALVAIVQVPIIGPARRRMTVREAARLQSFPDAFIPNTDKHQAYKQFGNAVNVEVIRQCSIELFRATGFNPA